MSVDAVGVIGVSYYAVVLEVGGARSTYLRTITFNEIVCDANIVIGGSPTKIIVVRET